MLNFQLKPFLFVVTCVLHKRAEDYSVKKIKVAAYCRLGIKKKPQYLVKTP